MSSSFSAQQCHNSPFALAESAWVGMSFTSHLEFLLMADGLLPRVTFSARPLNSADKPVNRATSPFGSEKTKINFTKQLTGIMDNKYRAQAVSQHKEAYESRIKHMYQMEQ